MSVSVRVWQHMLTDAANMEFLLIGAHPPYAVSDHASEKLSHIIRLLN